jgi:hypothetical protein
VVVLVFFVGCGDATERRRGQVGAPAAAGLAARTNELDVVGGDGAMVVTRKKLSWVLCWSGWLGQLQGWCARGWAGPGLGCQSSLRYARCVVGMELMRGVSRGGLNQTDDRAESSRGS